MYLNPEDVFDYFIFDLMSGIIDNRMHVLDTFYIHKNSKFRLKIWACITESLCRTTNNCKSF